MQTDPVAIGWALALLAGLPLMARRTGLREEHARQLVEARSAVYVSAVVSTLMVAGVTLAVAAWRGLPAAELGWTAGAPDSAFAWAGAVAVAGLGTAWGITAAGRRLGFRESPLARLLMPRTAGERVAFLALATVAAVGEEYIYRGYLQHVMAAMLGDAAAATVLVSVSFGFAHGYQRVVGIVRASVLGGLLTLPVLWTGSLFPAIVAHFWINAAIGLGGWRVLLPADEADADVPIVSPRRTPGGDTDEESDADT